MTRVAVTRVAVTRVAVTRVAVTRVAVTRVAVTRVAQPGVIFALVRDLQEFAPRDFADDQNLVGATLIALGLDFAISHDERNLVHGIEKVVIEAVRRLGAIVHTMTTNINGARFLKGLAHFILLTTARPIRIEDLVAKDTNIFLTIRHDNLPLIITVSSQRGSVLGSRVHGIADHINQRLHIIYLLYLV